MKNEDHCRVLNGQTLEKQRDALSRILSNFLKFAKGYSYKSQPQL